jgi:transposase InsO family protein
MGHGLWIHNLELPIRYFDDIGISMDGKGRCMDNVFVERLWRSVKYEEIVCCERFVSA